MFNIYKVIFQAPTFEGSATDALAGFNDEMDALLQRDNTFLVGEESLCNNDSAILARDAHYYLEPDWYYDPEDLILIRANVPEDLELPLDITEEEILALEF